MSRIVARGAWWLALLTAGGFAAYWLGLLGGVVFDDFPDIIDNSRLRVAALDWSEWLGATFASHSGPVFGLAGSLPQGLRVPTPLLEWAALRTEPEAELAEVTQ